MQKNVLACFTLFTVLTCFSQNQKPEKPSYENMSSWAAHPLKEDFADKQPKKIAGKYATDTSVDVFFIHPTSYTGSKPFGSNGSIIDEKLNETTDEGSIKFQASVFNSSARVFAPRYRQAHLSCFFPLTQADSIEAVEAFSTAYTDVKDAFEYYLKNYNNGKPIIIASHSQGTYHARTLLKEFFDDKPLQSQLVAAYLVGLYVPENLLAQIPVCKKPNSTGCIVGWRTFERDFTPEYINREKTPCIVVNPITWDIDKPIATKEENKGILKRNFDKISYNLIDASVVGNILWVTKPNILGIGVLKKNYHVADYNFFYLSIKENIAERVKAYWEKRKY